MDVDGQVNVYDDDQKPWSVKVTAFTPAQWVLIEQYARQIMKGSGYGKLVIEIANRQPQTISCEETIKLN
jgi:hypothetical protein